MFIGNVPVAGVVSGVGMYMVMLSSGVSIPASSSPLARSTLPVALADHLLPAQCIVLSLFFTHRHVLLAVYVKVSCRLYHLTHHSNPNASLPKGKVYSPSDFLNAIQLLACAASLIVELLKVLVSPFVRSAVFGFYVVRSGRRHYSTLTKA